MFGGAPFRDIICSSNAPPMAPAPNKQATNIKALPRNTLAKNWSSSLPRRVSHHADKPQERNSGKRNELNRKVDYSPAARVNQPGAETGRIGRNRNTENSQGNGHQDRENDAGYGRGTRGPQGFA